MAREYPELSAYIDGELSGAKRREVEARLLIDPTYAHELERLERMRTMLAIAIEQPTFHSALMRRVHEEEVHHRSLYQRFKRAHGALVAAAAALLIGFYALQTRQNVPPPPAPGAQPASHAVAAPIAVAQETEPTPQTPPAPTTPVAASEQTQATDLPFALLAVDPGPPALAAMSVNRGAETTQVICKAGDLIMPDVTLAAIRDDEVDVRNGGQMLTLAKVKSTRTYADANGQWRVAAAGNPDPGDLPGRITITHDRNGLLVFLHNDGEIVRGSLKENHMQGTCHGRQGNKTYDVEGDFNTEWTRLDLRLTSPRSDSHPVYRLTRIPSEFIDAESKKANALAQCEEDARKYAKLLDAYASAHEGKYPPALKNLAENGNEEAMYEDSPQRTFKYVPGRFKYTQAIRDVPTLSIDANSPSIPDALVAHEQELEASGLRRIVFPEMLLEITYSELPVTIGIDTECRIQIDPHNTPDLSDPAKMSEARAKDQNNLKQLMLVVRLFENENNGFTPGGWLTAYPEYLTDPSILTSPKDKPGTDSYLYLLPATNINGMMQELDEAGTGRTIADTPALLNKTDFPGIDRGRNVAYADGHVEYVRVNSQRWQELVVPALRGQF